MACQQSEEKVPKNFVKIVIDLKLAQAAAERNPENFSQARQIILSRAQMDWREFNQQFQQLLHHPKHWKSWPLEIEKLNASQPSLNTHIETIQTLKRQN